ncbi:MAG: murein biosynthesis integral membrane protein MurJ [Tissierellaceae bacterium]|nr:murein biosynthesis integral membrane protein MurJ [Tissierellaceae bacterium]
MKNRSVMRRNTLYIIHFAAATRILIFFKDVLIASKLGVSYKMDSYILALSTIMLITKMVGDGIVVALIPLLQEIQRSKGIYKKIEYTNNLINTTVLLSLVFVVGGFFGAPYIIKVFGPGFRGEEFEKAIMLFRLGLPIITLSWVRAICGGFLQSDHAFRAGAKGGASYEIALILYLAFFAKFFEFRGLMVAGIIGVISQIYIALDAMKDKGYRYEFRLNLKDKYLWKVVAFLFPIILGVGVNELNKTIDNAVASTLPMGSIAELNYANEIVNLFIGLFIVAIVTVIFPILSESSSEEDLASLKEEIHNGLKTLLIISIPVSVILMIMAEPIVKIFFERGAFDWQASFFTSRALVYYALGLPAMALIPLITRTYYSFQDMKTPIVISLAALTVNFILNIVLSPIMGAKGIALGTSVAAILAATMGLRDLNWKFKFSEDEYIKNMAIRLFLSTASMIVGIVGTYSLVSFYSESILLYNGVSVGVSSAVGIGVYALAYKVFDI